MKGEIPECRRCCCCIPLRYGLLVWGYIKMTADALIITSMLISTIWSIQFITAITKKDFLSQMYEELIVSCIGLAVFLVDLVVTIMFVIGGHKKNVELIRVFYYISIAMWIFTFLLTILYIVISIFHIAYWKRTAVTFSFYFVILVVQTYFLILLRTEIIKLQNIGEFRFVNNAAEAECTMTCEDVEAGEETVREDV